MYLKSCIMYFQVSLRIQNLGYKKIPSANLSLKVVKDHLNQTINVTFLMIDCQTKTRYFHFYWAIKLVRKIIVFFSICEQSKQILSDWPISNKAILSLPHRTHANTQKVINEYINFAALSLSNEFKGFFILRIVFETNIKFWTNMLEFQSRIRFASLKTYSL